jgi:Uma2 family endonuclease
MSSTEQINSADQLLHAPGLGRYELVRGELIMMSPPGSEHGRIEMNVAIPLGTFVRNRKLGTVFGGDTGFLIGRDPDTVRSPDVAFVRSERIGDKLGKGFFPGAPDLAVEVLSPNDRAMEVLAKVHDWLDAGCREVWVVDPDTRQVVIHYSRDRIVILTINDEVHGGDIVPGFAMPVAEIFAD